ncbi:hypothetical protein ES705_16934 [subsurface metagenome]
MKNNIISGLEKIDVFLDKITVYPSRLLRDIGGIILFILVIMTAIDVGGRYLFSKPLPATYELTQIMFCLIIFFGMSWLAIQKGHIKIDLFLRRLPLNIREILDFITGLLSLMICIIISWQAIEQAIILSHDNAKTFIWRIPLFPFEFLIALTMALFAIILLGNIIKSLVNVVKKEGFLWLWLIPGSILSLLLIMTPMFSRCLFFGIEGPAFGGVSIIIFLVLLFFGMPVGFALFLMAYIGMGYMVNVDVGLKLLAMTPYSISTTYVYSVMPLFIAMGLLSAVSGIARDLYESSYTWIGHQRGGLAMATVVACAFFAAICGDSMATAVTMGSISLPEMKKYNYKPSLAAGAVAAGGTIGILIPPSAGFIIYGLLTDQSIGKLFIAGILPGILMTILFVITIYVICKADPELGPRGKETSIIDKLNAFKGIWGMLVLFLFVLIGIYAGIFTPTEAGALGSFGVLVIILATKRFNWQKIISAFNNSVELTAMIFLLFIGAIAFTRFFSLTGVPRLLANFISGLDVSRLVIMLGVLLFYIIAGCFMNAMPVVIITLPILYPTIVALGYDPIWFGVIMVIMVQIGVITPPMGMNVFAISGVAKGVPLETIFKGIIPFWIAMMITVLILILFPQIATFLPNLMYG